MHNQRHSTECFRNLRDITWNLSTKKANIYLWLILYRVPIAEEPGRESNYLDLL